MIAPSVRAEEPPRATPPRPLSSATASLTGIKVLVVDDERDAREFTATVLRHAGADVAAVDSADAALRALEQILPDVILCDIAMPDRDGFDLIAAIRQLAPPARDVPMAALTAYAKLEDRNRVLNAGFRAHLAKPLDPADITAVVEELARGRSRHATALNEVHDHGDDREHHQHVNGGTGDMEHAEAQNPGQAEQNGESK